MAFGLLTEKASMSITLSCKAHFRHHRLDGMQWYEILG